MALQAGNIKGFWTIGSRTEKMGTRTDGYRINGSRTNGSGLGLGQGNNCPEPICSRIILTTLQRCVVFFFDLAKVQLQDN